MWILETSNGDRWTYAESELENARRDQYIFGGKITHADEPTNRKCNEYDDARR